MCQRHPNHLDKQKRKLFYQEHDKRHQVAKEVLRRKNKAGSFVVLWVCTIWNKKYHIYYLLLFFSEGEASFIAVSPQRWGHRSTRIWWLLWEDNSLSWVSKSLRLCPSWASGSCFCPLLIHQPSKNEDISRKYRLPESQIQWLRTSKWAARGAFAFRSIAHLNSHSFLYFFPKHQDTDHSHSSSSWTCPK